jgi:hypothetical protein
LPPWEVISTSQTNACRNKRLRQKETVPKMSPSLAITP